MVAIASGDVDGVDGGDTAVLLTCSPQPSNGILQEVLVHAGTGRPLGALPSPRTLQGSAPLPPVYDRISVEDGEIVAGMSAYAASDSHASGPSQPFTVRWRLGPLEWLLATPAFHHWHHTNGTENRDRNYAAMLPVLDRTFGTLHLPRHWPEVYGVDTAVGGTLVQQIVGPLAPDRLVRRDAAGRA